MSSTSTERAGSLPRQLPPEGSIDKETSKRKVWLIEMLPDRNSIEYRKYPPRLARLSIGIPPKESNQPIRIAFAKSAIADSIIYHGALDALAAPRGSEAKVVRAKISSVQERKNVKGVRTVTCLSMHRNDIKRLPDFYARPREIIDEDLKRILLSVLDAERLVFATDSSTEELAANAKRNELINTRGEPRAAVRARHSTSE